MAVDWEVQHKLRNTKLNWKEMLWKEKHAECNTVQSSLSVSGLRVFKGHTPYQWTWPWWTTEHLLCLHKWCLCEETKQSIRMKSCRTKQGHVCWVPPLQLSLPTHKGPYYVEMAVMKVKCSPGCALVLRDGGIPVESNYSTPPSAPLPTISCSWHSCGPRELCTLAWNQSPKQYY